MSKRMQPQSAARKNAEHYFKRTEQQPDAPGKQMNEGEHKAGTKNTARLREPRLAMRAVEKNVGDNPSGENGAAELALRCKRAPVVRSILRMRTEPPAVAATDALLAPFVPRKTK
jgi:hypothetical protein